MVEWAIPKFATARFWDVGGIEKGNLQFALSVRKLEASLDQFSFR